MITTEKTLEVLRIVLVEKQQLNMRVNKQDIMQQLEVIKIPRATYV